MCSARGSVNSMSTLMARGSTRLGFPSNKPAQMLTTGIRVIATAQFSTTIGRYATINQIKRGAGPPRRKKISMSPDLERCPFKKGVVLRVMVLKPKKPNSAQRKACRVRLTNGKVISAYIPGEGHNAQEHSIVYVRGGRCQDLPGVKYHLVRGAGDLSGVVNRISSRSKYGVKKPTSTS